MPGPGPAALEQAVLARLAQQRVLIVLDNAETLVAAVEHGNDAARDLAAFIRALPGQTVSLLLTSRVYLGWAGEQPLELSGLTADEGAQLFRQSAPQRTDVIDLPTAKTLSDKVAGHPLSLRLLGGAFNGSGTPLAAFVRGYEQQLLDAEDKYREEDHRHRTLHASIATSVRYLNDDLRALLSGLWLFHAPFLPETAEAIFDPDTEYPEGKSSPVHDQLHALQQRSLLARESVTTSEGTLQFYRLLPTLRPYVTQMAQTHPREDLLTR